MMQVLIRENPSLVGNRTTLVRPTTYPSILVRQSGNLLYAPLTDKPEFPRPFQDKINDIIYLSLAQLFFITILLWYDYGTITVVFLPIFTDWIYPRELTLYFFILPTVRYHPVYLV